MSNNTLKIVDKYREPAENEFFFNQDPRSTAGVKQLIDHLETKLNFVFEEIPHWQVRSIVKGDYINSNICGLRLLTKEDWEIK